MPSIPSGTSTFHFLIISAALISFKISGFIYHQIAQAEQVLEGTMKKTLKSLVCESLHDEMMSTISSMLLVGGFAGGVVTNLILKLIWVSF
jgi:hypothetical protein